MLLAGFENKTGEAVFDATLAHALAVQLGQSPFLNIVADDRVRDTLPLMGARRERAAHRRAGPRGVPAARDARDGARLDLAAGRALRAAARSDRVRDRGLARARAGRDAARRAGARDARRRWPRACARGWGSRSSRCRPSTCRWRRRRRPRSRRSARTRWASSSAAAAPRSRRSRSWSARSQLDPGFAAAATTLSTVYGNLGEASKSAQYARRAYDEPREGQRARAAVHRLPVPRPRHRRHAGGGGHARRVEADLPQRLRARQRAGAALQPARSLRPRRRGGERGARADPRPPVRALEPRLRLSRLWAAPPKRSRSRSRPWRSESPRSRRGACSTRPPCCEGDAAAAQRQLDWAAGKPREFDLVAAQAQVAAYEGRLRRASELYRATRELADRRGLPEAGLLLRRARRAGARALRRSRHRAGASARRAVSRAAGGDAADALPRLRAMTVLGLLGAPEAASARPRGGRGAPRVDAGRRRAAADDARRDRARARRPAQAIEELRAAAAYETGTAAVLIPTYLRGRGRAASSVRRSAARLEFERILEHRGVDPFSPVCAMARLGVARALAASAERERAAGGVPRLPRGLVGRRRRSARAAQAARSEAARLAGPKP